MPKPTTLPPEQDPEYIKTNKGYLKKSDLQKKEHVTDNRREHTVAIEYKYHGELVRRDVHVTLKEQLTTTTAAGEFK